MHTPRIANSQRLLAAAVLVVMLEIPGASPAASNFGAGGYPQPDCVARPVAPQRPAKFESEAALRAYNLKVVAYNSRMEHFVRCIQEYVDNASQDIKRIREHLRKALDKVR